MREHDTPYQRIGLQLLLLLFALIILCWPMLAGLLDWSLGSLYLYLFGCWAAGGVLLLFLISHNQKDEQPSSPLNPRRQR